MPRPLRLVIPDCPHHITQRGNYKQHVFFEDADRHHYLELLSKYSEQYGVAIEAYCLMENHVHLVVVPDSPASLSRMMQRLNTEYARWIHAKRNTAGHLWQARYYSVALDHRHFCAAMVYVEQNPSRAGLVSQPWQWPWSSAAAHLGLASSRLLNLDRWQAGHSPETWKLHLELGIYGAALEERIRDATRHGRPVGSDEFLASLESRLKRPIRLSLGGRPRKKPAASGRPPKVPACAAS